jgi:hypothetical protein
LSDARRWLLTGHGRRYHQHDHGSGHGYQSRFRSFPIQDNDHLGTVVRSIERKPVYAGRVEINSMAPTSRRPSHVVNTRTSNRSGNRAGIAAKARGGA